jgi:hypothetical protein
VRPFAAKAAYLSILLGKVLGSTRTYRMVRYALSAQGGYMGKLSILKEFWGFLKERKKWWLAPMIIMLLLLGILIFFTQSSAVAPFIYTLF